MNSSKLKVICMFFMISMFSMSSVFAHRPLLISWGPEQEIVIAPRDDRDYFQLGNTISFIVKTGNTQNGKGKLKCSDQVDGRDKIHRITFSLDSTYDDSSASRILFQTLDDCYRAIRAINNAFLYEEEVSVLFHATPPIGIREVTKILIKR